MDLLPEKIAQLIPKERNDLKLHEIEEEIVGKVIRYMIDHFVDFLFQDYKNDHEGKSDVEEYINEVQAILDITWEKLNTGYWKDVNLSWRFLYSYATLFKILFVLIRKKDNYLNEAVKVCDYGIIMGAPILDNLLKKIASVLANDLKPVKDDDCEIIHEHKSKKRTHHKTIIIQDKEIVRVKCPSLEKFKSSYMDLKQPVIIEDAIDYWPALSTNKWSIDYLLEIAGCRLVPIEIGNSYTDKLWSQKLVTLEEFIKNYILKSTNEIGYLAQHNLFDQIQELRNDIAIPTYCSLAESEDEVDINAWFGPEGTISPLHHDPKHNLLAQVMGEKYVRLYDEENTPMLYPHPSKLLDNTSQVDVENPDLNKFPKFSSAQYQECILKSGEVLYIPRKCWHYVRSLSVSFSVSFWWH
ncbi:lysine-specific demethylase 8 [Centruroides vittatus]|uniref:lysine-specific demethylase 8 n=1 Tax=Centruroides vittatus TaxID=120091 RepID=UPI00350EA294